jgi:hypothetical protein
MASHFEVLKQGTCSFDRDAPQSSPRSRRRRLRPGIIRLNALPTLSSMIRRGCFGSGVLQTAPVTPEAAGSSPVAPVQDA